MADISPTNTLQTNHKRVSMLMELYMNAKCDGRKENFDITPIIQDNYENYYIMINLTRGVYKGQTHILEFKSIYGDDANVMQYPINPPLVIFRTPVYHTNISEKGSICLDIFKDSTKWAASYTISAVIRSIILLLDEPNELSPWNKEASNLYVSCKKQYKLMIKHVDCSLHDEIEQKCFASFKTVADKLLVSVASYGEWFPQLVGKPLMDISEFEQQLIIIAQRKQRKPKASDVSDKKINRFARYVK
jgi:hypothetical protein